MVTRHAPIFGLRASEDCIALTLDPRNDGVPAEDVEHPFVLVDESGVFARLFLAYVQTNDGRSIPAVVKIQKDTPSPPAVQGFGRSYTNRDAEAAFAAEAHCLADLGPDGEGIIPPVHLKNVGSEAPSPLPIVSLPVTYCKKVRKFFHPPCPYCGGYLKDCRDEVMLAQAGLPSYTGSGHRFLFCSECGGKSDERQVFYTASPMRSYPDGRGTHVRVRSELYRDFHRLVNSPPPDTATGEESPTSLCQFPCVDCTYKGACYPLRPDETRAIPAERMLYPVAYFEFFAIARELYDLHYDDFGRLLGGQSWEDIKSGRGERIPLTVYAKRMARLDRQMAPDSVYFWGGSRRERSATEILWLKLGAFEQLVEGVRRIYESCHRPHLDLRPKNVMVSCGEISAGQPGIWSFRVGLTNPAAAAPVQAAGTEKGAESPAYLNCADYNRLFTSPLIRRPPYGHEEYANVTIREIRDSTTTAEIEVDLISEVISVFRLTKQDRMKVTLNVPAKKLDGFVFWADQASTIIGGYRVLGRADRLRPDLREMLQSFVGQTLWDCRVNICRNYHIPFDLYSLGMILFCSLLANDEHDEAEICREIEEIGRKLTAYVSTAGTPKLYEVEQKLGELLAGNRTLFLPEAVFYRAADRKASSGDLPEQLWFACQKLGFAMITEIDGFSLCNGGGGIEHNQGSEPIKRALDRLNDLNLWAEGRLFAGGDLRRELREAAGSEK